MKTIGAAIMSLLVAGCGQRSLDFPHPEGRVDVVVASIIAEDCRENCRFIKLELDISNRSGSLICIPSVYGNEAVSGALAFRYNYGGEDILASAYDENPFYSARFRSDMLELIGRAQYVVQPKSKKRMEVIIRDQFDLKNKPSKAKLRFMYYPCAKDDASNADVKIVDVVKDVKFR